MGWTDSALQPSAERYSLLVAAQSEFEHGNKDGQPYPFFLAHPLQINPQADPQVLGDIRQWQIEWKYDGIRAQLVQRNGQSWLWSRGEDLITDRFPEISSILLPDGTVIDGEETIEQAGERILDYVIKVASGEIAVASVRHGQDDFIPWKRGVSL